MSPEEVPTIEQRDSVDPRPPLKRHNSLRQRRTRPASLNRADATLSSHERSSLPSDGCKGENSPLFKPTISSDRPRRRMQRRGSSSGTTSVTYDSSIRPQRRMQRRGSTGGATASSDDSSHPQRCKQQRRCIGERKRGITPPPKEVCPRTRTQRQGSAEMVFQRQNQGLQLYMESLHDQEKVADSRTTDIQDASGGTSEETSDLEGSISSFCCDDKPAIIGKSEQEPVENSTVRRKRLQQMRMERQESSRSLLPAEDLHASALSIDSKGSKSLQSASALSLGNASNGSRRNLMLNFHESYSKSSFRNKSWDDKGSNHGIGISKTFSMAAVKLKKMIPGLKDTRVHDEINIEGTQKASKKEEDNMVEEPIDETIVSSCHSLNTSQDKEVQDIDAVSQHHDAMSDARRLHRNKPVDISSRPRPPGRSPSGYQSARRTLPRRVASEHGPSRHPDSVSGRKTTLRRRADSGGGHSELQSRAVRRAESAGSRGGPARRKRSPKKGERVANRHDTLNQEKKLRRHGSGKGYRASRDDRQRERDEGEGKELPLSNKELTEEAPLKQAAPACQKDYSPTKGDDGDPARRKKNSKDTTKTPDNRIHSGSGRAPRRPAVNESTLQLMQRAVAKNSLAASAS